MLNIENKSKINEVIINGEKFILMSIDVYRDFIKNKIEEDNIYYTENEKLYSSQDVERLFNNDNPIKAFREDIGMSEKELAEKVGITRDYLSKIERGDRKGSVDVLKKIAEVLDVHVSHLL